MPTSKREIINEVAEQLKANPRRQRFLTELQDHLDDAERAEALGEVLVVSNSFNKYAVAHTRLVFYRTIIFACVVAIWSTGGMMTVILNNGEITSPLGLLAIPGWLLSLPIVTPGLFTVTGYLSTVQQFTSGHPLSLCRCRPPHYYLLDHGRLHVTK
ncbi:TPA: hypothetical protein DEP96_02610 [Candidatus Uhrbacteria bacterium]|nr:hypothetical protein [Candidatus Uhrbacteria bacterium]